MGTKINSINKNEKAGKSKNKKIAIAIILLSVIATAIFALLVFKYDLGPARPIKSSDEDAAIVGKCGEYSVRYEELRYVTLIHRRALDRKYGEFSSLSSEKQAEYTSELLSAVSHDIKNNYLILALCERYGIDVDDKEIKKNVNLSIESYVAELGGRRKYIEWLEENSLTDSFLRLTCKVDLLEAKLLEKLKADKIGIEYDEMTLKDFVDYALKSEDYVKTIHAYYPKDWKFSDSRSAKAHANEDFEKLLAVSDDDARFDLMRSTIGNSPFVSGFSTTGTNFYFTKYQMEQGYEDIAFSLSLYGVELFENDDAYYIIMRVPKARDEISSRAQELYEEYCYVVLRDLAETERDNMPFVTDSDIETLVMSVTE